MSAPIFLSFASNDRKPAETICKAVEQRGFACWIATRNIAPGENFQEAITRAIRTAKVMILVFSAHANNSLEVKKEIALAGRYHVIVVPIRVEDVVPNDALSFDLAVSQWIDLLADWENAIDRLITQISTVLQANPAAAGPGLTRMAEPALPQAEPKPAAKPARTSILLPVLAGTLALLIIIAGGVAWRFWPASGTPDGAAVPGAPQSSRPVANAETPPSAATGSLEQALLSRLASAASRLDSKRREDVARDYIASPDHKALAVPASGSGQWRAYNRPTREIATEGALESCQIQHGEPCVLIAVDDVPQPVPADGKWAPRDMPRPRYTGEYNLAQIPGIGSKTRERSDIVNYGFAAAPKAVAFHPVFDRIFVATQAPNQRAAEEEALRKCNEDPVRKGQGGPCFLYAVDNHVVLPLRLREPLTAGGPTIAAGPSAVPAPAAPSAPAQPVASRPPRPSAMREHCATPRGLPGVQQYCASSVLPALVGDRSGRSTYDVENLFDENPATAWVKARRQPGHGWILIDFDAERLVTAMAITNGYQKNGAVFRDNYRVRRLRLVSSTGETASVNVADQEGPQRISLDRPIRAEWLQIVIEDVYPGAREPDLAISELRVISQAAH